ncbi:HERV-H LTR-associating protein 1 [Dicentrarchus labrax]|uniref:HERV-H LTR-associating protein 1 n=1 Tax=Dicentrarchus labrax TaxID=13489 RepID=UPI0021F57024|nr:HERV-H LTR-associating protein 1 [Dicentrarchus labrax]
MAASQRETQRPRLCFIICASSSLLLLFLFSQAFRDRRQDERHKRDILDSTEIPAEHIDPAAIDLTPLVNTLINTSQSGSRQLFSLLSVTSYSSLALHKLTLLVYNISSIRSLESSQFRRRFCYCVTNETNDLTDFTAILLDVMGNSTSYLHELFKSASILSVSQRNNSDCIYICVMAGKMGREVSELWEVDSITPLFNQTIVEGPHTVGNVSSIRLPVEWNQLSSNLSHIPPSGMSSLSTSRVHVSPTTLDETAATTAKITTVRMQTTTTTTTTTQTTTQTTATTTTTLQPTTSLQLTTLTSTRPTALSPGVSPTTAGRHPGTTTRHTTATGLSPVRPTTGPTLARRTTGPLRRTTTPSRPVERPGCPWRRPELTDTSPSGSTTTVGAHKLQPCVLELCKFFSQCLCRPFGHKTRMKRYCDDSHVWYEKHTSEVCRRVRRVSFSRNLKQRCLTKMCNKL